MFSGSRIRREFEVWLPLLIVCTNFLSGCSDKSDKVPHVLGPSDKLPLFSLSVEDRKVLDDFLNAGAEDEQFQFLRKIPWEMKSPLHAGIPPALRWLGLQVLRKDCDPAVRSLFVELVESGIKCYVAFPNENATVAFMHSVVGDLDPDWFPAGRQPVNLSSELARWHRSDLYLFLKFGREPEEPALREAITFVRTRS